jgi:hypothetical protein
VRAVTNSTRNKVSIQTVDMGTTVDSVGELTDVPSSLFSDNQDGGVVEFGGTA